MPTEQTHVDGMSGLDQVILGGASGLFGALLLALVAQGCAPAHSARVPAPSPAPPHVAQPSNPASPPGSGSTMPSCAHMCAKQFACVGAPTTEMCKANCEAIVNRGKQFPPCGMAAAANLRCLDKLECPDWRALARGKSSGAVSYPCAQQELDDYLYCSGAPEASSCVNTCIRKAQCGTASGSVAACSRACVRDLWHQGAQYGIPCWNALVKDNICMQVLSCVQRSAAAGSGPSRPCAAEAAEVATKCQ